MDDFEILNYGDFSDITDEGNTTDDSELVRDSTADTKRIVSHGRLSETYLQGRLTPLHHRRKLFIYIITHYL